MEVCNKSSLLHAMTNDELLLLQAHLRQMYLDIEKVCDIHGLRVMIAFGSVLGAVRHQGFIPWDDDIDVLMPREDYDKFVQLYAEELPSKYKVYAPNSKNGAISRFCKVVDTTTRFITPLIEGDKDENGFFLDIFPLENTPSSMWLVKCRMYWSFFLMYVADSVAQYEGRNKFAENLMNGSKAARRNYRFRQFIGWFFSLKSRQTWYNLIDKFQNYRKDTGYVCWPAGPTCLKSFIPREKEIFFPLRRGKFDDIEVYLPAQPEKFCELQYGDWQELPPENKRYQHYIKEMKFSL